MRDGLGQPEDVPDVGVAWRRSGASSSRRHRRSSSACGPGRGGARCAGGRRRSGRCRRSSPRRRRAGSGSRAPPPPSQSSRCPKPEPKSNPNSWCSSLEPGAADAEDGPPAADVVDGDHRLGHEGRVAERVGADEQAEARSFGGLRQRRKRGVALEDRLMAVAEDGVGRGPTSGRGRSPGGRRACAASRNDGQSLAWLQSATPRRIPVPCALI